jgi:hypothetical protein
MLSFLKHPSRHATATTPRQQRSRWLRWGLWLLGGILLLTLIHPQPSGSSPGLVGYGATQRGQRAPSGPPMPLIAPSLSPWEKTFPLRRVPPQEHPGGHHPAG